jgi:hypothetical protein
MTRHNKLSLTAMALLGLAVVIAFPQAGIAQSNPWIGTWKTNLSKSTFSPGPPPKSLTLTFQTEGQVHRLAIEGINAQGNPFKAVFMRQHDDGKPYPVTGNPAIDAEAVKTLNDSMWIVRTKAGKVITTIISVMSADGKTFTDTDTGIDENGQPFYNVAVREKQ